MPVAWHGIMTVHPPCDADGRPAHRCPRCFAAGLEAADGWLELSEAESAHLVRVLRLRPGDPVEVFDGAGRSADARMAEPGRRSVKLCIESAVRMSPAPAFEGVLAQALPKGEKADWIVQKAVELNLGRLIFWIAARSEVRKKAADADSRSERWARIAVAAAKQCGRDRLLEIGIVSGVEAVIDATPGLRRIVCELIPGVRPLRTILREAADGGVRSIALHIGPEGGLAPDESAALLAAGGEPASMGSTILRTETAAIAAMCALNYEFSESLPPAAPTPG